MEDDKKENVIKKYKKETNWKQKETKEICIGWRRRQGRSAEYDLVGEVATDPNSEQEQTEIQGVVRKSFASNFRGRTKGNGKGDE